MFGRGVFLGKKREHVVCQDYWERFVFEANVKPFVFQYELFMSRDPPEICILTKGDHCYVCP